MMVSTIKSAVVPNMIYHENAALYRKTLLEDVVPFWMRHGRDEQFGGISNVLDDQGKTLSHDKFLWSQGRALWTLSALYNRIEKRPEWLALAHHIYRYLKTHGRDDQGRWMYLLDAKGNIIERDTSIYVDGFVFNGLGEYYVASGDKDALQLAIDTAYNVAQRLQDPTSFQVAPYVIPPGLKTHGIAMIFSFFFFNLGKVANDSELIQLGLRLAHEILDDFYQPSHNAILEFTTTDGKFIDTPAGRTCVPGHVLEGLWFLITIFERSGQTQYIPECCRLILRHLELGWDEQYGGLLLARDIDGNESLFWRQPECKPWWVQIEALVATAFAEHHTHEDWCKEWHERVKRFAFTHYPVPTGEWTQWLDRKGAPIASAGLPVKDPFHLPRGLIYLVNLLEKE